MIIGIPKEIKDYEDRVAMVPSGVYELVIKGHHVIIEKNAGKNIGFSDENYVAAGATIVQDADAVWSSSEMIVKVKEPQLQRDALLHHLLRLNRCVSACHPLRPASILCLPALRCKAVLSFLMRA